MPQGTPIRVLVVSDKGVTRAGYRFLLEAHPDITVAGEATRLTEGVGTLDGTPPDVVVVDTHDDVMDVAHQCRAATGPRSAHPPTLVLVDQVREHLQDALRAGVRGVLLNRSSPDQIASAVRLVAAGYLLTSSVEEARHADGPTAWRPPPCDPEADTDLEQLTRREAEILRLIARGMSNAEISAELFVSESTVKSHVQHLLNKLDLRNRVHAVIYAYEIGIVRVHPAPPKAVAGS